MKRKNNYLLHLLACFMFLSLFAEAQIGNIDIQPQVQIQEPEQLGNIREEYSSLITGAQQTQKYLPILKKKRVGIVTNATGVIGTTSIVDTLIKLKVDVKKIFAPEHGFRGNFEAGETVQNGKDPKTKTLVISLYGENKKPTKEQLTDIDVLIYDIQDVGVRFYTYISTLHYIMEACAENGKECIVLDRPNPNGFYIDGPVLQKQYKSFLGMHPVPVVYGMTCGEYAQMINGENWLGENKKCKLTVIPMGNYNRRARYELPVKPSPNLPNMQAILLYPSLGLFEGTIMSVGRGTEFPFQIYGHPKMEGAPFIFTPQPTELSKEPKYVNQICYGFELNHGEYIDNPPKQLSLHWLIESYRQMQAYQADFFDENFNYHTGNNELQEQIKKGVSEGAIRKYWRKDIEVFKSVRKKYLLYEDF